MYTLNVENTTLQYKQSIFILLKEFLFWLMASNGIEILYTFNNGINGIRISPRYASIPDCFLTASREIWQNFQRFTIQWYTTMNGLLRGELNILFIIRATIFYIDQPVERQ